MSQALESQLRGLGLLVQLAQKARAATTREAFGFVAVDETRTFIPYRQAVLWYKKKGGKAQVLSLSGLAQPDLNAPYVLWLTRMLQTWGKDEVMDAPHEWRVEGLPGDEQANWAEWLPPYVLAIPLKFPGGGPSAGLLLARETPWAETEQTLTTHLAEIYAHAWEAVELRVRQKGRSWQGSTRRRLITLVSIACLVSLALPVHQSVLAPAEVVAFEPNVVRASMEGVVEGFHVEPNQKVVANQLLFNLDDTVLNNRLDVAKKELSVLQAEYRQSAQKAVFDQESKGQITILQAKMEQHQAEMAHITSLLKRIEMRADRAGIAVFNDVNDWLGKPVVIGERVLAIADPDKVELDIRLPIADAINLDLESDVVLFLKSDPHNPLMGRLRFMGYQAFPTADNSLAYGLKARFVMGTPLPRIGLRGTAKLYGGEVSLAYYLLRRPLAAMRQMLGY